MAIAREQRNADAERDQIGGEPSGERPVELLDDRCEHDPDRDRASATHQKAAPLCQHHIGNAHEDRRCIDRQARQCALRDEGGIVVEREEDVGWSGRNRQGRDQRADHRP
ncbi:hypothetical protein IVB47_20725 [Bradyrhizobium sp. 62]|nr:hypothetical protein [Bradyrhizobium sp. 62]